MVVELAVEEALALSEPFPEVITDVPPVAWSGVVFVCAGGDGSSVVCLLVLLFTMVFGLILVLLGEDNVFAALVVFGRLPQPLLHTVASNLVGVGLWCRCLLRAVCWCFGFPESVRVTFVGTACMPWYATPACP